MAYARPCEACGRGLPAETEGFLSARVLGRTMSQRERTREELIKEVWPDKALYAATLLLITSVLGVLQGIAFAVLDITLVKDLPWLLEAMPASLVLVLSLVEAAGATVALRRQQTRWTLAAGIVGVLSLNLFGLGSVLAVIALVFVGLARTEGEDAASPEEVVPAETWPDKALAASTVLVVAGVLTAGWGVGLLVDWLTFTGYIPQAVFGWVSIALGALALLAAVRLYHQNGAWLGVLAGVGSVAGLALYAVGPILGLGAILLIWQARREDEFETEHGARAGAGTG